MSVVVRIADNIIDYCFDSDIKRVQRAIVGITVASADSTAVYNSETGYVEIVERVIVYSTEKGYLADSLFLQGDEFVSLTLNGKTKKITRRHHVIDMMLEVREEIRFPLR